MSPLDGDRLIRPERGQGPAILAEAFSDEKPEKAEGRSKNYESAFARFGVTGC